ncbi:TonB family protein [Candidatus Nitrospira bockiana]
MSTLPLLHLHDRRQSLQGWGISLVLHVGAFVVAMVLVADLRLSPQPEPFHWDVALVDPPAKSEAHPPSESTPPPSPPVAPAQVQKQPVEHQPVRQVQVARPVEQTEQIVQQEVKTVTPIVKTVQQPIEQRAQPITPPSPVVTQQVQPLQEAPQQTVTESPLQQAVRESRPVEHRVVAEAQPVVQQSVTHAEAVEAAESVRPQEAAVVSKPVTEATPSEVVESVAAAVHTPAPVASAPSVSERSVVETTPAPVTAPQEAPVKETASVVARELPAMEHAPVEQKAVRSAPATKADYQWLVEALWNRVMQLKRYPYIARLNRWEGQVVLRAVIKADGTVAELEIAKSSGHTILDKDAMEVIRQASPLKLKHPLGKPQIVVNVPISYTLQ